MFRRDYSGMVAGPYGGLYNRIKDGLAGLSLPYLLDDPSGLQREGRRSLSRAPLVNKGGLAGLSAGLSLPSFGDTYRHYSGMIAGAFGGLPI